MKKKSAERKENRQGYVFESSLRACLLACSYSSTLLPLFLVSFFIVSGSNLACSLPSSLSFSKSGLPDHVLLNIVVQKY